MKTQMLGAVGAGIFSGLLGFGAALSQAATAVSGDLYFTIYSGKPNVKKVPFNYDGTTFTLGAIVNIATVDGADGLIFAPDKDLLVGGQANLIHKVNYTTQTVVSHTAGGTDAYHMAMDPSQNYAWASGIPGGLAKIPLNPFADGTTVPLNGDDTVVTSLAFQDATHGFYTSSTADGNGSFGTLDMTTFTTHRLIPVIEAAHGMAYDPFSSSLLIFGGSEIAQIEPATGKVLSTRFITGAHFDQGTVDGKGHLFVANNNGPLIFIDYSVSKLVGDTTDFIAQPFLANNLDDVAPLSGLGSNPIPDPGPTPNPDSLIAVAKGLYKDANGNGRIDQAWIEFPSALSKLPDTIQLQDPFSSAVIKVAGSSITRIDATHIQVDFKDREFAAGTGFDPKPYGKILADKTVFSPNAFIIGDGVGPRPLTAESFPPQKDGDRPSLTVTFTEPVTIDVNSKVFPFDIKRAGSDPNGKIVVESIKDMGGNTYVYTFDTTYYPLPGDSLRLQPGSNAVVDAQGNKSNMKDYIGISGNLPKIFYTLETNPSEVVAQPAIPNPVPLPSAILVVDQQPNGKCLNCDNPATQTAIANTISASPIKDSKPYLVSVKVNAAFRFSMSFFDNLGTFVNKAEGDFSADDLKSLDKDADGNYLVGLYWWPVSDKGAQVGTGAYIVRGSILTAGTIQTVQGTQGQFLSLNNKEVTIFKVFGYLRR